MSPTARRYEMKKESPVFPGTKKLARDIISQIERRCAGRETTDGVTDALSIPAASSDVDRPGHGELAGTIRRSDEFAAGES